MPASEVYVTLDREAAQAAVDALWNAIRSESSKSLVPELRAIALIASALEADDE